MADGKGSTSAGRVNGPVDFLGSFAEDIPRTGLPEVAFAGRSNVGKSSAINTLLGQTKVARVSRTPGRTQRINLFSVGGKLTFADLPGYGYAKVPAGMQDAWRDFIEGYLGDREELRLVVVLVDGNLPAQPMDAQLLMSMRAIGRPTLVLATKFDRIGKSHRKPTLAKLAAGLGLPPEDVLPFSSLKKEGIDDAWARIRAACGLKGGRAARGG